MTTSLPDITKTLSSRVLSENELKFLEYPQWEYFRMLTNSTKEYAVGADITKQLLHQTQELRNGAKPDSEFFKRINDIVTDLWQSYLYFLDNADNWFEYVNAFNYLKKYHVNVFGEASLIFYQGRHDVIMSKISRQAKGKSVKHLRHKQSSELTKDQYRQNLAYAKRWIRCNKRNLDIYAHPICP
jgi:hypothetical protein